MRKHLLTALFFLVPLILWAHPDKKKIEQALFDLKNVSFKQIEENDDILKYELFVTQPIDHKHPEKGTFKQKVHFTHRAFEAPVIMETNGYELYARGSELQHYLGANYLNIEHRYFGQSTLKDTSWDYLNLEQATGDLHEINQLFKALYPQNKWISTGISKGGQTTLYYRYFYPNDVDVSIPYVAPFNESLEDPRIYNFLAEVGNADCREKIKEIQLALLKNKAPILEKLTWYAKGANLSFDYIGSLEKAFEYAVLEYEFSFWQGGKSCETFPDTNDTDTLVDYFLSISNIDFFSDKVINRLAPHFYQAGSQMGYYGFDITPFKDYLSFNSNPLATFMPEGTSLDQFDDKLIKEVRKWIDTKANDFLYIYGGTDTWSATRVIPTKKVNSKSFILPNKDHYEARVEKMTPAMQKEFFDALEKMTGIKPVKTSLQ